MKMPPDDRKNAILKMLEAQGRLSVEGLAATLNASPMTINRDIRELASEGKIRRLRGIILLPDITPQDNACALCRREVSDRSQFIYLLPSRKYITYCCPHCGLCNLDSSSAETSIFATDFLYGTLIDAYHATFLIGSRVNICCSPSVLCYANQEDAISFQKGFGGEIFNLEAAAKHLFKGRK